MLSLKCFQKLACVALFVSMTGSAFAEGNGGGYQGPDLNGISIPVRLDRGITLENAQNAVFTCMISGDRASGRVALLARFVRQVYGGDRIDHISGQQSAVESVPWEPGMPNELLAKGYASYYTDGLPGGQRGVLTVQNREVGFPEFGEIGKDVVSRVLSLYFQRPDALTASSGVRAQTQYDFPRLVFDQIVPDVGYDEWGAITYRASLLKNIAIRTGGPLSANTPLVVYRDWGTPKQTVTRLKVTINTQEYVECLQTELQKRAN